LLENTSITCLDLTACRLVHRGPLAMANTIRGNCTLKTVSLGWNGFADLGAMAIAEALKSNTSITELNLSNNRIGRNGCEAIGRALGAGGNSTLEILDCSFVSSMHHCSILMGESLDLFHLGPTPAAARAFALYFFVVRLNLIWRFARLTLSPSHQNPVTPAGVVAIVNAAKVNFTLKTVYMHKVPITAELGKVIAAMTTPSDELAAAMDEQVGDRII